MRSVYLIRSEPSDAAELYLGAFDRQDVSSVQALFFHIEGKVNNCIYSKQCFFYKLYSFVVLTPPIQ